MSSSTARKMMMTNEASLSRQLQSLCVSNSKITLSRERRPQFRSFHGLVIRPGDDSPTLHHANTVSLVRAGCSTHGRVSTRFFSDSGKQPFTEEHSTRVSEEGIEEKQREEDAAAEEAPAPDTPETEEAKLHATIKDLRDQLLRSLAEQENTRRIAKRDVEAARSYAVSSFAKSLLDTSDNLARARESVPPEFRSDTDNHPILATLYEGIKMTEDGLNKAFIKNGLRKFGTVGDKFNPELHEALFEYTEQGRAGGTLGQIMKVGFLLNGRVLRPAEVGVIKNVRTDNEAPPPV